MFPLPEAPSAVSFLAVSGAGRVAGQFALGRRTPRARTYFSPPLPIPHRGLLERPEPIRLKRVILAKE